MELGDEETDTAEDDDTVPERAPDCEFVPDVVRQTVADAVRRPLALAAALALSRGEALEE